MADPTPALPWAKPGDEEAAPPIAGLEAGVDQQQEPQFLTLEQANLALGARIEVGSKPPGSLTGWAQKAFSIQYNITRVLP
jgi:hypothetical protein